MVLRHERSHVSTYRSYSAAASSAATTSGSIGSVRLAQPSVQLEWHVVRHGAASSSVQLLAAYATSSGCAAPSPAAARSASRAARRDSHSSADVPDVASTKQPSAHAAEQLV